MENRVPVDPKGRIAAVGSSGFSESLTADGTWQEVILTNECKTLSIQCDAGDDVYTHIDSPVEFHYCFNSDGTGRGYCSELELSIACEIGETVCYVRATSDLVFSINGLK